MHAKKTITFCGFSMGSNQYWAERVYDLCVYYMTGTPEGSTESGFYGEAGNLTCDPWFTRHKFIPYTTAANVHAWVKVQNFQNSDLLKIKS